MFERVMLRIGAVALAAGLVVAVVFEVLHPSREDPDNNPVVFAEYAQSSNWTTLHLGALAGALMLMSALIALSESFASAPRSRRLGTAGRPGRVAAAGSYGVVQ